MRRRRFNRKLLRGMVCCAILGIGGMSVGFHGSDLKAVEIQHTVQPSETFWSISEKYKEQDRGREIYLPEFQDEIIRMNPWLSENHRQVRTGDKIMITVYVPDNATKKTKSVSEATDTDF